MSESILAYSNGNKEFRIEIGTSANPITYQVIGMMDYEAPEAFQKERTTKVLDPTVDNTVRPPMYDGRLNMYDTGLHETSQALMQLYPDDANRKTALTQLTKLVLNPWGKIRGIKNLEPDSLQFWDNNRHTIALDNSYDTSKVEDLANLYQLILHGKLCPAGFESEFHFKTSAQYSVENKTTVISAEQKRKLATSEAIGRFITLSETDKKGLEIILEYMGISGVLDSDKATLNIIFTDWLSKDDNQNPREFLELCSSYYDSEAGKKELVMFKALKDLNRVKKITQTPQGFYLDSEFIGTTLKAAAKTVLLDKALLDKVYEKTGV